MDPLYGKLSLPRLPLTYSLWQETQPRAQLQQPQAQPQLLQALQQWQPQAQLQWQWQPQALMAAATMQYPSPPPLQPQKGKFNNVCSFGVLVDEVDELTAFVTLAAALSKHVDKPPVSHMPGVWLRHVECSTSHDHSGTSHEHSGKHTITGVATGAYTRTGASGAYTRAGASEAAWEGFHTQHLVCYFKYTLTNGVIEGRPDVEKYSAPNANTLPANGLDRDIFMAVHQRALQAMAAAGYLRQLPGCVRPSQVDTKSTGC